MNIMEDRPIGKDDEEVLVPSNPIERRDAKIAVLEKNVSDMFHLKEDIIKTKAELKIAIKTAKVAKSKVKFAREVTEEIWTFSSSPVVFNIGPRYGKKSVKCNVFMNHQIKNWFISRISTAP